MGIDIGFVGEDLASCAQARCAEHRQTLVGFAEQVHGQLLEVNRLDTPTVQLEAPESYRPTGQLDRDHFALVGHREKVVVEPAEEGLPGELLTQASQGGCFRYALIPQGVIGREAFEERMDRVRECSDQEDSWVYTAWDRMLSMEERLQVCRTCPVRPPGEDNCYARFSNYPGMESFKRGLSAIIVAMACIDRGMQQERKEQDLFAWWTFRRLLERTEHDSLTDLHGSLLAYFAEETQANMRQAEAFFEQVTQLLGDAFKGAEDVLVNPPLQSGEGHHDGEVDRLLAGLIYRPDPYDPQEMGYLLRRLHAYQAVAEWALWRTTGSEELHNLILGFSERWRTLTEMLRTGWLLDLRVFVSY